MIKPSRISQVFIPSHNAAGAIKIKVITPLGSLRRVLEEEVVFSFPRRIGLQGKLHLHTQELTIIYLA